MPSSPLTAVPEESPQASPVVEVITPTGAPHLAVIADEISARLLKQISALSTDVLLRLLREGEAIARERAKSSRASSSGSASSKSVAAHELRLVGRNPVFLDVFLDAFLDAALALRARRGLWGPKGPWNSNCGFCSVGV